MDHGFGVDVPETLAEFCRPERLALVVYDMQVGVVRQLPDGAEVTRAAGEVTDLGFVPVVVTDACGSRDCAAAERALAGFAFAGDALVTDVATLVPLLRGAMRRRDPPEGAGS